MIYQDLSKIEMEAKARLKMLKAKYPNLDAYLVYSSQAGQVGFGASSKEILSKFPAMVVESKDKASALKLLKKRSERELAKLDCKEIDVELEAALSTLQIDENTHIELRFGELQYDLVWQLQSDRLVNQTLTPHTRSSIRIVLGRLSEFHDQAM